MRRRVQHQRPFGLEPLDGEERGQVRAVGDAIADGERLQLGDDLLGAAVLDPPGNGVELDGAYQPARNCR